MDVATCESTFRWAGTALQAIAIALTGLGVFRVLQRIRGLLDWFKQGTQVQEPAYRRLQTYDELQLSVTGRATVEVVDWEPTVEEIKRLLDNEVTRLRKGVAALADKVEADISHEEGERRRLEEELRKATNEMGTKIKTIETTARRRSAVILPLAFVGTLVAALAAELAMWFCAP